MIIKGRARSGGSQLAAYLLNKDGNERAALVEMRGLECFGGSLRNALIGMEIDAKASGCHAPLYHASFRVEEGATLTPEQWREAADRLEKKLGMEGHERALVMHEKPDGESHLHVVWNRIDQKTLEPTRLEFDAYKRLSVARELEREFGTRELSNERTSDEQQPTRADYEQAHRQGRSIGDIKAEIRAAWERSDNGASFEHALSDAGYILAKGDKRDFVAVDHTGQEYTIGKRITGATAAQVRAKCADLDRDLLPSVDRAKEYQQHREQAHDEFMAWFAEKGQYDEFIIWLGMTPEKYMELLEYDQETVAFLRQIHDEELHPYTAPPIPQPPYNHPTDKIEKEHGQNTLEPAEHAQEITQARAEGADLDRDLLPSVDQAKEYQQERAPEREAQEQEAPQPAAQAEKGQDDEFMAWFAEKGQYDEFIIWLGMTPEKYKELLEYDQETVAFLRQIHDEELHPYTAPPILQPPYNHPTDKIEKEHGQNTPELAKHVQEITQAHAEGADLDRDLLPSVDRAREYQQERAPEREAQEQEAPQPPADLRHAPEAPEREAQKAKAAPDHSEKAPAPDIGRAAGVVGNGIFRLADGLLGGLAGPVTHEQIRQQAAGTQQRTAEQARDAAEQFKKPLTPAEREAKAREFDHAAAEATRARDAYREAQTNSKGEERRAAMRAEYRANSEAKEAAKHAARLRETEQQKQEREAQEREEREAERRRRERQRER